MVGSTDLNPEPPVFSGSTNKKGSSGSTKLILTSVGKEMPGATTAIRMTCTWRCSCMSGCTPPPSGAENPRPNQWRHPPARSLGDEMVSSVAALWRTQEEKWRRKNKCSKAWNKQNSNSASLCDTHGRHGWHIQPKNKNLLENCYQIPVQYNICEVK